VLFLRMHAFSQADAAEQASRREQLAAVVRAALPAWEGRRRVVLESADGLAVVGAVAPEVALQAAQIAAEHGADGSLGIALHHGPVRAVTEPEGGTRVVGDGIETASALAGFSTSHAVVASQSFRDALAARVPREAENLQQAGEQVDDRLRSHALFVYDPAPAQRRAQRRTMLGVLGLLGLLGAGLAGRVARESYEAARRPAIVRLDIRPSGEVFVDGEPKGTTPPLVTLSLPPGPHTIEVRNGRFKPLRLDVHLKPGEEMELKHVFAAPPQRRRTPPREQGVLERFKFW
jgi:hypothetical protein